MSFSVPARALQAVRPSASPGLLAVSAVVSAVFTATPFAIAAASEGYGISAGTAAWISTAQVGGFTVANLVAGRWIRPTGRVARNSAGVLLAANARRP